MQSTIDTVKTHSTAKIQRQRGTTVPSSYAIGEINAYIAIRDELLLEAEETATSSKLDSLTIANDFVDACLTPSRAPYELQSLPKGDAKQERQRCRDIKSRIATLRQRA
jgi:hypothetical protein